MGNGVDADDIGVDFTLYKTICTLQCIFTIDLCNFLATTIHAKQ